MTKNVFRNCNLSDNKKEIQSLMTLDAYILKHKVNKDANLTIINTISHNFIYLF